MAISDDRAGAADLSAETRARAVAAIVVGTSVLIAFLFAIGVSFPNAFDELAHVSAVREQVARPLLFPDLRAYRLLDADDLTQWSGAGNYLNHPSPYYLGMAAFAQLTDAILPARCLNIALSTAALLLVLYAGWRHFETAFGRAVFAIAAASFPKQPVIAAGVNNDNLAACAAAAVFAGMAGARGAGWWLAGGLALAGWTKLTALLALATVVGCRQLWRSVHRQTRWLAPENIIVAAGLAAGCIPYAVNLLQIGHVLYVNEDHFRVSGDARPALDAIDFLRVFFTQMAMKWSASEYSLPLVVAAALMLFAPALAVTATMATRDAARICVPYLIGGVVTLTIHALFGWTAFQRIGDLTIAQTRYYNVLWPGIAFGAAMLIARLRLSSLWVAMPLTVVLLIPTVIGGAAIALL